MRRDIFAGVKTYVNQCPPGFWQRPKYRLLCSAGPSLTSGLRQELQVRQKVREQAVSALSKHSQYPELAIYDWQGALLQVVNREG